MISQKESHNERETIKKKKGKREKKVRKERETPLL